MPETAEPGAKAYYAIREASRITQVPAYTIRYWERSLRLPSPTRINGGQRRYTPRDLETILKIKELVGRQRLTLAGAKRALTGRAPRARGGDEIARVLARQVREELDAVLLELDRLSKSE